jgi:hypothetical protein
LRDALFLCAGFRPCMTCPAPVSKRKILHHEDRSPSREFATFVVDR